MAKKNYSNYSKPQAADVENVVEEAVVEETVEKVIEEKVEEVVEPIAKPVKTTGVVNCTKLNIRKNPAKYADIVCVVDNGTILSIDNDKSTNDWYAVSTSKFSGFCMKEFVTV